MVQFGVKHSAAHQHYGKALKLLLKQLDDKATKETERKVIEVRLTILQLISSLFL